MQALLLRRAQAITHESKRRLLAVSRVAASAGAPSQHASPGVHVNLQVSCPKLSVTLAGGVDEGPWDFLEMAVEGMETSFSQSAGLGETVVQVKLLHTGLILCMCLH